MSILLPIFIDAYTYNMAPGNPRTIPADKTQVNFNANAESLNKLRIIALNEQMTNTELLNLALDRFIEDYEKKNGKIKAKNKGKGEGLKGL